MRKIILLVGCAAMVVAACAHTNKSATPKTSGAASAAGPTLSSANASSDATNGPAPSSTTAAERLTAGLKAGGASDATAKCLVASPAVVNLTNAAATKASATPAQPSPEDVAAMVGVIFDCGYVRDIISLGIKSAGVKVPASVVDCIVKGAKADIELSKALGASISGVASTYDSNSAMNKLALGCGVSPADLAQLNAGA